MDNELTESVQPPHGSLETGIAGDYSLTIGEVLNEAWRRIDGNKGTIWLAILLLMLVSLGLGLVASLLGGSGISGSGGNGLIDFVINLLILPPTVGFLFVGLKIACDRPATGASIFSWYRQIGKLVMTYILMLILIIIGFVLLVLPGIYLSVAYSFALPLAIDKDLGPWQALEASRKAVTHRWFAVFGLYLIGGVACTASVILLGIPLIWLLPAYVIGIGIIYRNIFGAEEATLNE